MKLKNSRTRRRAYCKTSRMSMCKSSVAVVGRGISSNFSFVIFCFSQPIRIANLRVTVPSIRCVKPTFSRDPLCSDLFGIGSTVVRIHSVYTGPVPYGITFKSIPIWYQIADAIRTGSTGSRLNTGLIRTYFVPVPNGLGPMLNAALKCR